MSDLNRARLDGIRVLYVDDEDTRAMIILLLESVGATVVAVASADAVVAARKHRNWGHLMRARTENHDPWVRDPRWYLPPAGQAPPGRCRHPPPVHRMAGRLPPRRVWPRTHPDPIDWRMYAA